MYKFAKNIFKIALSFQYFFPVVCVFKAWNICIGSNLRYLFVLWKFELTEVSRRENIFPIKEDINLNKWFVIALLKKRKRSIIRQVFVLEKIFIAFHRTKRLKKVSGIPIKFQSRCSNYFIVALRRWKYRSYFHITYHIILCKYLRLINILKKIQ